MSGILHSRNRYDTAPPGAGPFRLALTVFLEPYAWKIVVIGFLGAAMVMALLGGLVWWVVTGSGWVDFGWILRYDWSRWLFSGLGAVVYLVTIWFLFPIVFTAVAGIFLEDLADRIERRHYPELPLPRKFPLSEQIRASIRGLLRGLFWNALALPLYFIPVLNVLAYTAVNSRLLSREYFQVVALRHFPVGVTRDCFRNHRARLWRQGLALVVLFVIPVVQLVAPLLATALTVHRLWQREDAILRRELARLP
ncbi:MAG: EI24 domain-containing protein [Verrucomicrobiales bacterium]